mgnify:CR=1 FL=1|jgi:transcriptional regulator with PAS, ATPase and Fis domain
MSLPSIKNFVPDWAAELPLSITITDADANIIYMNDKAAATFNKYGGETLIGKSLFDCHNPLSADTIRKLLKTGGSNVYTIEKQGQKKLIWQSAWFTNKIISGLVEISIVLPTDMPHHNRD